MELVDIGANLTEKRFAADLDEVLARAHAAGVQQIIATGASVADSEQAAALAASKAQVFATAGIHPHHAEETTPAAIERLRVLAQQERVLAVGETGLDFFRDITAHSVQIASFEAQMALAADTGLPIFLHERDAYPTFAELLSAHRHALTKAVVHCFTGTREALHAYLDLDCHIGITGWICDARRGTHLLELVSEIPRNRLMLETDAPYLIPPNISPKPKARRNEPQYLPLVCETVAQCLGMDSAEVARMTSDNARAFFGLPRVGTCMTATP